MKNRKNQILIVLIFIVLCFSACTNHETEDGVSGTPTEATAKPSPMEPAPTGILNAYSAEASAEYSAASEEVCRSLTNIGNNARMRKVMEKLAANEEVTIAYIGGSITEGYTVKSNECYAYLVSTYLQAEFNNLKIKTVNAGISGTPSSTGMLRLQEDVLSKNPDLVVVEFAVNDAQDIISRMMYESLVKDCLTAESAPAVILLLTVTKTGYSCEDQMTRVGVAYELPVINVKSAIWQEISAGNMTWADYSKDEAHPSADGHQRILQYFKHYFNMVLSIGSESEPDYSVMAAAFGTPYTGMNYYYSGTLTPESTGGFASGNSGITAFLPGWSWKREEGGSFTFTMTGKNLFMLYKENNSETMGSLEVYIDGKFSKRISANASDGYNNVEFVSLLNHAVEEKHTVELRIAEDSVDKIFQIVALATNGEIDSVTPVSEEDIPYTERAILSAGNTTRLEDVFRRAEDGEPITIGFIGGSITQGSGATDANKCYAKLVYDWWTEQYPDTVFTYINAGIGATTSQFACARAESDLLQYKPDIVIVEFSVNDDNTSDFADSYESLLRKVLTAENNPAVLVLNMVHYDSGYNVQGMHNRIAVHYELPIVSMKESIYKEITLGHLTATGLSSDMLHPNNSGHAYAAEIVTNYLSKVKNGEIISETGSYEVPAATAELTFIEAVRYDSRNSTPRMEGFTEDTSVQNGITDIFKNGYKAKEEGASITFTVEGCCIALQYRKTNRLNAPKAVVIIDGDEAVAVELDGNYPNGWGDWLYLDPVYKSSDSGTHTVEIRITEAGANDFYLVSLITR